MSEDKRRRRMEFKLIENKKVRQRVFEKRMNSLLKKAKELSILCDIKMLLVFFGPNEQNPEFWPNNVEEATKLINSFKQLRRSVEKNQFGEKFPMSDFKNIINQVSQDQLQNLCNSLDAKIAHVMSVIHLKQALAEGKRMLVDQGTGFLNKGKEKEVLDCQGPVPIQQDQRFQPNWRENAMAEGTSMFLDLGRCKEEDFVVYEEPVAIQQDEGFQNWMENVMAEGPRMFLNPGTIKEKDALVYQGPVAIQEDQGFQPNWMENAMEEGSSMFLDLGKCKEEDIVVYQEPLAIQQDEGFQNWMENALAEGPRMFLDLGKVKEKDFLVCQGPVAMQEDQGFQPNLMKNPMAEGPTLFLNKEKDVLVYQEPVAVQQDQSYQPNFVQDPMMLMQNQLTYDPVFDGSASSSNIPCVPLPVHQVDQSWMELAASYMNDESSMSYCYPAFYSDYPISSEAFKA